MECDWGLDSMRSCQAAQPADIRAAGPGRPGRLVGPTCPREPAAQVRLDWLGPIL